MLMSRKFPVLLMLVAFAAAAFVQPGQALADDKEQAAIALIKNIGDEAVKTLADKSLSEEQKQQRFEHFLDSSFDMPLIGRFVLGQYWRTATDAQRSEFQTVFRDFMVASYSQKIGSYSGENLKIGDATSLNDKESLVHSLIERPSGPPIKLDWRVRKTDSGEKIVDVIIEGISMAQTHRSEFASVISQPGVGVDGLITKLKDQIKTASK